MAAAVQWFCLRKWVLFSVIFFLFASVFACAFSESQSSRPFHGRRRMLAEEDQQQPKKMKSNQTTKNQTKIIKPLSTNSTKKSAATSQIIPPSKKLNSTSKSSSSTKLNFINLPKKLNSTLKISNSTKSTNPPKKLNSTSKISNSTKSTKQSLDPPKPSTPKNKTLPIIPKQPIKTPSSSSSSSQKTKTLSKTPQNKIQNQKNEPKKLQKAQKPPKPNWVDEDDIDDDLVAEFRDLPTKFHQTIVPDLERISTTSKVYINKANKEIIEGFRPLVGKQYASTIAPITSCIFIFAPLLLVSLIINRFKAYFSLQKILIFVQVYLSIYFTILCLAALITGLEPLKFFYATSQSSYVWLQVLQTLGYVLYLLLLLMYLVLVFSTETGLGSKVLGLGQTFVGFAVGLDYYVKVFHRAVLHQPPKTNWKVHGIYATCFLVISLFASAERRKKAYLEEGGGEGKRN